jgi:hypothetical protein
MNEDEQIVLCDKCSFVMHRDFQTDFGGKTHPGNWPMTSYAAGVHPKQIKEMQKFDAEHGVPTHYSDDGDPIFTSPRHRRKYCEAHSMFDRNAGLSDPVPERCR